MYLIDVFLPLYDNERKPLPGTLFDQVAAELTEKFGGLTAHTRAPAQGLWQSDADAPPVRDDIVSYEVMAESLDREWWQDYRARLETRFRQEQVIIRAQTVHLL